MNLTFCSRIIPVIITLFIVCTDAYSQNMVFEFGTVTDDEANIDYYRKKYPDAPAVIIGDYGDCNITVNDDSYWHYVYTRTVRIIVLNELGLDFGDVRVRFYETPEGKEDIVNFRANVFNEDGGRIRRQRVRQRAGHEMDHKNNWRSLNFALPGVREGSIIEYRYTKHSQFMYNLPNWQFQYEIPVEHSEYLVGLPQNFTYRMRYRGFEKLDINSRTNYNEAARVRRTADVYGSSFDAGTIIYSVRGTRYRWVARNLPPLRIEPHIDNMNNYASTMVFELMSFEYTDGSPTDYIADTWENVLARFNKHEYFGKYLLNASSITHQHLEFSPSNDFHKNIASGLELTRNLVSWNNSNSRIASKSVEEVIDEGFGNSAEVNLILCAILRNLRIDAHPVVLSTVDNIRLMDGPTYSELNYVMVAAFDDDGNYILLDATDPALPIGYLPLRTMNGKGKLLHAEKLQYVDLVSPGPYKTVSNYHLKMDDAGNFEGTSELKLYNYANYLVRTILLDGGEIAIEREIKKATDANFFNFEIKDEENPELPIIIKAGIRLSGYADVIENEIFFEPLLMEVLKEHDFQSDTRMYPVEFFFEQEEEINITIELPENIRVVEIPEPHKVLWGRNFTYNFEIEHDEENNRLIIAAKKVIKDTTIQAERYNGLVEFYDRIVNQNKENVVLERLE